jgi:hypothetical protein
MAQNSPVFIDTGGRIAILNKDDQFHGLAAAWWRQFAAARRLLVSTDWMLSETGNGLARTQARSQLPGAVTAFENSAHGKLIRIDANVFHDALELYGRTMDKTWGLVDCASFIAMRREQISDALTADRHFEQAGFKAPLLENPPAA